MVLTISSSMSAPLLCSALAMADSMTFLTIRAPFFGEYARMFSAWPTDLPRTRSATGRPFCAERRTPRSTARVSIIGAVLLGLLGVHVTLERTGQGELAKLVANHVFSHKHGNVLTTVMNRQCQTEEFGQHCRTTRPGLDRALVIAGNRGLDLLEEVRVYERTFFQRTSHGLFLISCDDAARSCWSYACCYGYGNP